MKYLKLIALLLIGFSVVFTSCEDNVDQIIDEDVVVKDKTENNLVTRNNFNPEGSLDFGCFTVDYPFSLITINENVIEITSQEDFEDILYDTVDYVVDFVYPLDITYEDGETAVINNIDELGEAFGSCLPDEGWSSQSVPAFILGDEYCISLVYPLTVSDIEENTYTVDSEEEFIDLLASNNFFFFEFPITVVENESGEEIVVSNEEEFFESMFSCEEINQPCDSLVWDGQIGCYDIVFPTTLLLEDGSEVTVENSDELTALLAGNEVIGFVYPLDLIEIETGESVTVNSEEELIEALINCGVFVGFGIPVELMIEGNGTCYDMVFPVSITDYSGVTIEVSSIEELEGYVNLGYVVELPLTVVLPDGTTVTLATFTDIDTLFTNC